jgi:hypothetical protein
MGFFGISLSLLTIFCLFGVFFIWDWRKMSRLVLIMSVLACFVPGINMLMAIAFAGTLLLRRFDL